MKLTDRKREMRLQGVEYLNEGQRGLEKEVSLRFVFSQCEPHSTQHYKLIHLQFVYSEQQRRIALNITDNIKLMSITENKNFSEQSVLADIKSNC